MAFQEANVVAETFKHDPVRNQGRSKIRSSKFTFDKQKPKIPIIYGVNNIKIDTRSNDI